MPPLPRADLPTAAAGPLDASPGIPAWAIALMVLGALLLLTLWALILRRRGDHRPTRAR